MKRVTLCSPHHVEETEETTNQNLHLQWYKYSQIPYGNCKLRFHLTLQVPARRVPAVVPWLGDDGRSCVEHVGHVKPPGKSPRTKAPAPSGAHSQGRAWWKYLGPCLGHQSLGSAERLPYWISSGGNTAAWLCPCSMLKFRDCILGLAHCLSTDTAREVIN